MFTHLDELTNGVSAELINATDGVTLLGIRVLWTIKHQYLNCQYSSLRVELNPGELGKDITVSNNSAECLNLDCNRQYKPRVRAIKVFYFDISHYGSQLFYGGTSNILCCATQVSLKMTNVIIGSVSSIPSQLSKVCAGLAMSDSDGKVNVCLLYTSDAADE